MEEVGFAGIVLTYDTRDKLIKGNVYEVK
jgi:hypothetical protein